MGAIDRRIYYHGGASGRVINPSDSNGWILPPTLTGVRAINNAPNQYSVSPNKVYLTTNIEVAEIYAAFHLCSLCGIGHAKDAGLVYAVEPWGAIEPDNTLKPNGFSFSATRAQVLQAIIVSPERKKQLRGASGTVFTFGQDRIKFNLG